MKIAAITVFLLSAICLFDPAISKGQLLDGTAVGRGNSVEHFEEGNNRVDNLNNIQNSAANYNLLLKRTGGVQNTNGTAAVH